MLRNVINMDRFPIDDLETPSAADLVTSCRTALAADGIFILEGFVSAHSLSAMQRDAASCFEGAYKRTHDRTVYLSKTDDPVWPEKHPRRRFLRDSSWIAPCDLIPEGSLLRQFYTSDTMRHFCAAALGMEVLYLNECPYQAINIIYLNEADYLNWHFDTDNAFTVNVLLEDAEEGGVLETASGIRTADDESYGEVARVLDGDTDLLQHYELRAGSLIIFRGQNTLHRVTTVCGHRRRTTLVMCYEERPGVMGDPNVNAVIYGPRVVAKLGVPMVHGTSR